MILYKDWGKHLRWGNYAYLLMGLSSFANLTGNRLCLPRDYFAWKYLENPPEFDDNYHVDETFHFRTTQYSIEELNYILTYFKENKDKNININLGPHLQSLEWTKYNSTYVKSIMKFKDSEVQRVKDKYAHIFNKKVIGIGIRRGDFINHGCFYQIPLEWYLRALKAEFPDWEKCNILFFSDHIEEIKTLFRGENFYFADANGTHTHADNFLHYHKDPMEQFILGTLCQGFVAGQSTFNWHQMKYVHDNGYKVVHAGVNLIGSCAIESPNDYFYPTTWTLHKI